MSPPTERTFKKKKKKSQNNADINSFVGTHHHHAVYTELYFLCFIFLTEFSNAALGRAPGVENH